MNLFELKKVMIVGFVLTSFYSFGQALNQPKLTVQSGLKEKEVTRKGSWYLNWGYNRDYYRNTDIYFKGEGYEFTLKDVSAHDLPEEFNTKVYFNVKKLTIPQFNFRVGYFLRDNLSISAGWDHMKYRITEYQQLYMDGYIDPSLSTTYGGDYDEKSIILTPDLLRFEHTDGLNFIRVALEHHQEMFHFKNDKIRIANMMAVSAGLATPWTDFTFLGERYLNWLHVAGWGVSGIMGLRAHYGRHVYLQYRMQVGYLKLNNILLQNEASSRANHNIKFTELAVSLGYNFGLKD